MSKFLQLYMSILLICGAACSPTSIPTMTQTAIPTSSATATHTPTLAPALEVLNWNIQFATGEEQVILRCTLVNAELQTQQLLSPILVKVRGTLVTRQILEEAQIILNQVNQNMAEFVEEQLNSPEFIYLLFGIDFQESIDPYAVKEYSREFYPGFAFPLNEIKFNFSESETDNGSGLYLQIDDNTRLTPVNNSLPVDMVAGELYAIPIDLENLSYKQLGDVGFVTLEARLIMFPPFRVESCQNTNNTFSIDLNISNGLSRSIPALYGDLPNRLTETDLDEIRLELLNKVLIQKVTVATQTSIPDRATSIPTPTSISTKVN